MNSPRESLFVPVSSKRSYGRFWHGSAVHLAGRTAWTNVAGHFLSRIDFMGMQRNQTDAPAFFTERTLAAYLAVSDRTIRNWIRRGDLPSYKLGASRRIDPADVDAFLTERRDELT
jgi:excisionase family DNA binding protein